MAIDMNVDVGELIKGLFSKKSNESGSKSQPSPYLKIILMVIVVIALIAAYVFLYYLPTQKDLKVKNYQISQVENLKMEIVELNSLIEKSKVQLIKAEADYNKLTNLFHTDKELEDLYRHISMLALRNNLMVSKIEKGAEELPIFEVDSDQSGFSDEFDGEQKKVAYYEFIVDFEISGNFSNYVKFRKGLAELKKIINLKNESIVVLESETSRGEVRVTSSIATYRFPADDSEKYINPN